MIPIIEAYECIRCGKLINKAKSDYYRVEGRIWISRIDKKDQRFMYTFKRDNVPITLSETEPLVFCTQDCVLKFFASCFYNKGELNDSDTAKI